MTTVAALFGTLGKLGIKYSHILQAQLDMLNGKTGENELNADDFESRQLDTVSEVAAGSEKVVPKKSQGSYRSTVVADHAKVDSSGGGNIRKLVQKRRAVVILSFVSIIIINPVCDIVAYAFASQAILVPLKSLSIVFNALLAPLLIHETLTKKDIKGTAVIVFGCTISTLSGSKTSAEYSWDGLMSNFSTTSMIVYQIIFPAGGSLKKKIKKFSSPD